jgi:hypothetical protein
MRYSGRSHDSAARIQCQPPHSGEALRRKGTLLATSGDTVTDELRVVVDGFAWRKWFDIMTG